MDSLKGAFNSFTGGNNEQGSNQQHHQQGGMSGEQYGNQQYGRQQDGMSGEQYGNQQYGRQQGGMSGEQFGNQQYGHQQGGMSGEQQYGGHQQTEQKHGGGGLFGGLTDKLNTAAGGGRESEKDEDYLDKGVDFVQEKFLHQGKQDNESAIEQAKDEQISDFIRDKYKSTTGKDFFIKDKPTRF